MKKTKTNQEEQYKTAIAEFIKETFQDPRFFQLRPEQQKEKALQYLKKHQNTTN